MPGTFFSIDVPLGASSNDASGQDVVVLDDFMFTEPLPFESQSRLVNISTRGYVGTGDAIMVGGFVVEGVEAKTILVRGVGPGIAAFVSGALVDPTLDIVDSAGNVIALNDSWGNSLLVEHVSIAVGAFPFSPGSSDAATVVVLNAGAYTVRVSGVGGSTGIALVEAYDY